MASAVGSMGHYERELEVLLHLVNNSFPFFFVLYFCICMYVFYCICMYCCLYICIYPVCHRLSHV